jgi:hypothetical protein
MICTIYSHFTGFQKIKDIVQSAFPQGKLSVGKLEGSDVLMLEIKGGLFKKGSKLKIQYRQRNKPSYQITEDDGSDLTTNLRGLYGYISELPTNNELVTKLFLQKILTLNCEFAIWQEEGETKELQSLIAQLAGEFDAILFVQPGTVISKSPTQHFLDKELNLLLDQEGHCEVNKLEVKIDSAYFDRPQNALTEDQIARKADSEKILEDRNIKINRHLPCIESESGTILRQPKEIAQRAAVLAVTNMVAFSHFTSEEAVGYLQTYNLWPFVTPDEQAFLANPTEEKKNQETWKCEGIWTLLWALQKVDNLPFPDELCNLGNIPPEQYPLAAGKDPNDFINSITSTRSKKEILDANDLYYRFNWACVDARINGREILEVHPGIVYERQYALNWLIRYMDQDWDDVTCDT